MKRATLLIVLVSVLTPAGRVMGQTGTAGTSLGSDLIFLRKHTDVIVLSDASGNGQLVVLPAMQGRVRTSSASGMGGLSFGWHAL